jgi:hypothetical protein
MHNDAPVCTALETMAAVFSADAVESMLFLVSTRTIVEPAMGRVCSVVHTSMVPGWRVTGEEEARPILTVQFSAPAATARGREC